MIGSNTNLKSSASTPIKHPVQAAQPSGSSNFGPNHFTFGRDAGGYKMPDLPAPQPTTTLNARSTIRQPNYIDINDTEDAVNNTMAQGHRQADQRFQMKQLDRAGLSRGKGQQFISAQESTQAVGQAANQAAELRSQDQMANSKMRSDYERARELEAQNYAMVQHQLSQADWSRQFGRESAAAQLQIAMMNARMQLMQSLMRNL